MRERFGLEDETEQEVLDTLGLLAWKPLHGKDVAPGSGERKDWKDLTLHGTLLQSLQNLNPGVPLEYLHQAIAEVLTPKSQDAITENERIHQILVHGYRGITYIDHTGVEQNPTIYFFSADHQRNTYHAVNQVTVRRGDIERRFDIVLYVNGMALSIMELKRSGSAKADSEAAFNQLSTYVREMPSAFATCVLTLASDGVTARYGTPFTPWNHYAPWNVDGEGRPLAGTETGSDGELEWTLHGIYDQARFGDILRNFVQFSEGEKGLIKKVAKPHQYFAVTKALVTTEKAMHTDGRAGVVWHTQGSGKSLEMEFYTAAAMRTSAFANPTIILLTDRTELDTQLFDAFNASLLLPEQPIQVASRADLRASLSERRTGGIYFTTLQKFGLSPEEKQAGVEHPQLSDRRNIIVIADEAHRSHYDNLDGHAKHLKSALPHATLLAFTGTPISEGERDTRAVFGDHIDVYDFNRAVEDGATVPVFFEARLIKLARIADLDDAELDDAAEELTAGLDDAEKARIQQQVAVLDTLYGSDERIAQLADDVVKHWERRRELMQPMIGGPGKGMIITSTRNIAAKLYAAIIERHPDWHSDQDSKGTIKVVYSAAPSDPEHLKVHMRRPSANAAVKKRLKDPDDELELVIVKDMMITGFDAPALHTLYVDRTLRGALLMQALARINRTFRGKDSALLVGYAPISDNLNKALQEFTRKPDGTDPDVGRRDTKEAATLVLTLLEKIEAMGLPDWRMIFAADPRTGWSKATRTVANHLRSPRTERNSVANDPDARPVADTYRQRATRLSRAWALAAGDESLASVERDVKFYEGVRVFLMKMEAADRLARGEVLSEDMKRLLADLIVDSSQSTGIVEIYKDAGLELPRLDELSLQLVAEKASDKSEAEIAIESLRTAILSEARRATRGNDVRNKQFSERVNELMLKYVNGQLTEAEIIARLHELAQDIRNEHERGKRFDPALDTDELSFYDVLVKDPEALDVMGDDVLGSIAREIVARMRRDTRTDWTVRDDVKARLRSMVKRLLRKHGYPPSKQQGAVVEVLERMEQLAPKYAGE